MPFLPILLADGFVPTVSITEHIRVGQPLAKKSISQEASINLSEELGVPPKQVGKYLKKNPGDSLQPGDIIAIQKNLLGSTKEKVVSTTHGVVTRYDRESGTVYIHVTLAAGQGNAEQGGEELLFSPIDGVVSLCNNEKILLETDKDVVSAPKGIGGQSTEEIKVLEHAETVAVYHLDTEAIGKIIIGTYFPKEVLVKAVSMGVKGVIGTKILDGDLVYLQSRNAVVPVIEISSDDHKKLVHWAGKKAFVHGEGKTIILLHT
jgi:hypothetical protein